MGTKRRSRDKRNYHGVVGVYRSWARSARIHDSNNHIDSRRFQTDPKNLFRLSRPKSRHKSIVRHHGGPERPLPITPSALFCLIASASARVAQRAPARRFRQSGHIAEATNSPINSPNK
jgi:hypothetical protein